MALFSNMELTNLQDLLVEQLQDLYDAENRLVDALPKMVDAATDKQLKAAFGRSDLAALCALGGT